MKGTCICARWIMFLRICLFSALKCSKESTIYHCCWCKKIVINETAMRIHVIAVMLKKMRFFHRSLLTLAGNVTSLGAPMMIANATSIHLANATLFSVTMSNSTAIHQTLAYVWLVFLSALLACIIITTVLGEWYS